ncbi:hypothetical protein ACOMHN_012321 [Nucella lapillus]
MTGLGPDSDGRSGEQGLRAGAGGHGQKSDIRQTRGSSVSPISSTPRPSGHRQREAALAAKTSLRRSGSRGSKSTDIPKLYFYTCIYSFMFYSLYHILFVG